MKVRVGVTEIQRLTTDTLDYNNPRQRVTVQNLTEVNVYEPSDIFSILEKSWKVRKVARTEMNEASRYVQYLRNALGLHRDTHC